MRQEQPDRLDQMVLMELPVQPEQMVLMVHYCIDIRHHQLILEFLLQQQIYQAVMVK